MLGSSVTRRPRRSRGCGGPWAFLGRGDPLTTRLAGRAQFARIYRPIILDQARSPPATQTPTMPRWIACAALVGLLLAGYAAAARPMLRGRRALKQGGSSSAAAITDADLPAGSSAPARSWRARQHPPPPDGPPFDPRAACVLERFKRAGPAGTQPRGGRRRPSLTAPQHAPQAGSRAAAVGLPSVP